MKKLFLQDILKIIEVDTSKYKENLNIDYVTEAPSLMRDNTLYFDLDNGRYARTDLFKGYDSSVIITEHYESFKALDIDALIIKVDSARQAYWKFVDYYRNLFPIPIIGVTGTCGKTTTKEIIKHILSSKYKVYGTNRSQNASYLDLHYLIGMDEETDFGVIEMGVLWPGDLTDSCRVFKPQIRIILNMGVYHLTSCETPEAYHKAKAEILEGINEIDGILLLNGDDENVKKIDVSHIKNVYYFSINKAADYKAKDINYTKDGMNFILCNEGNEYKAYVSGFGKHNIYNALAAIAAVNKVGMSIENAIEALATFEHVTEHLEVHSGAGGCTVFDDTWSSAPPSVIAALDVLKETANSRKKIALIGIMPLLGEGDFAKEQYAKIGEKAVETGVDMLIVVGDEAMEIGIKALELGMDKDKIYFSNNGVEIYNIINPLLHEDTVILLKVTHRQMVADSFKELKSKIISDLKES